MRKIEAYQCEYCEKKVYTSKSSCYAHEKKCYWNPVNKACASCGHQNYLMEKLPNGNFKNINVCSAGNDISNKLKFDCKDHRERTEEEKEKLFI